MPAVAIRRPRLAVIDLIRGIAVIAMVVYHFSWDLLDYSLIDVDVVNDPLWRAFAHVIAGTFLALVGFNLVLANRNGIRAVPYLRRLGIIAGAAALVSLGTYWFMPGAFVFFGILHMIAAASVLALPFLRAPVWVTLAVAAIACLAAPSLLTSEFFDAAPFLWLGLSAASRTDRRLRAGSPLVWGRARRGRRGAADASSSAARTGSPAGSPPAAGGRSCSSAGGACPSISSISRF